MSINQKRQSCLSCQSCRSCQPGQSSQLWPHQQQYRLFSTTICANFVFFFFRDLAADYVPVRMKIHFVICRAFCTPHGHQSRAPRYTVWGRPFAIYHLRREEIEWHDSLPWTLTNLRLSFGSLIWQHFSESTITQQMLHPICRSQESRKCRQPNPNFL